MSNQMSVAAIHDISGMGKCSLTAVLPVLSSAGVSVSVLPTAVLSTQTGGLNEYTYRDLTDDMRPIMDHWHRFNMKFDAVYSGFLGSKEQVDIVCDFVNEFKHDKTFYLCDPAMADNGELYNTFDISFVDMMRKLCSLADIIVPNYTEAAFLLGKEYISPPYSKQYTRDIITALANKFGCRYVVLTGVDFDDISVGAAAYDSESGRISYSLRPRIKGMFHSTGDLFASSLLGALMNGFSLNIATEVAIDFTVSSIKETVMIDGDSRFGLCFERCLPQYMKRLGVF